MNKTKKLQLQLQRKARYLAASHVAMSRGITYRWAMHRYVQGKPLEPFWYEIAEKELKLEAQRKTKKA